MRGKQFSKLFMASVITLFSNVSLALDPYFVTVEELDFKTMLPIVGSCEMDDTTAVVSDLPGSKICSENKVGTRGHFRIFSDPFTEFYVRVFQKNPEGGDGLTFVPEGTISSPTQTISFSANTTYLISSGNTGIINIIFGGQLYLSNEYPAGMTHSVEVTSGIEWYLKP